MDSFEKGFSSQPSASPKPSLSGVTKENDVNHMGSNFKSQNPKKPVTKHFMSPTISATSKVTVPRKKILAEKNESTTSCDNAHYPKSPFLEARNGLLYAGLGASPHRDQTSSWANSACVNASDFDDGEVNNCFADSSVRPYDPLTNYLSPRPKFLRYKPNRRRDILQRSAIFSSRNQEIVDEQKSSECNQEESLDSSPQEGSSEIMMVKAEDNHHDGQDADSDEDEESEEAEVPESWCLKELVKFLLLLVVIGLSTSYILSMNNPRPSPVVQAVEGLMEGYHRIQKHLFEAVYTNEHSSPWRNGSEMQPGYGQTLGFTLNDDYELGRNQIDLDDEEEWDESTDEIIEMPEPPTGEFEDISEDDERDEDLICPNWKSTEIKDINDKVKEINEAFDQFPVFESAQTDAATDQELNKVEKDPEGLQQCASLERYECFHERMDHTQSASRKEPANLIYRADQLENDQKADQIEGAKAGEEMARNRQERIEDATTTRDGENYDKAEELNRIYVEEETNETELHISGATTSSVGDENFLPAKIEIDDDTQPDTSRFEIGGKSIKDLNFLDIGPIAKAMIMFSIISIFLKCRVHRYRSRAIPAPLHDSQLEASDRKEELIQAEVRCVQVQHVEERAESVVKPSSVSISFEKAKKETYIHAPDIELLGEFVIGEFSTVRNSDQKGRMIETGESIYSISHVESRAQPVGQAQTVNVSSTGSPSYGSFTAEKIMPKKQGGREGNVKVVTTPVRRSSRIRNLSAASP